MKRIKNILVATDFSPDSKAALDEAVEMALKFKANIYLVHAIEEMQTYNLDYFPDLEAMESVKKTMIFEAQRRMNREIRRYNGKKGVTIVGDVRYGHTIDEILNEESERHIDLVVMAPHLKKTLWQKIRPHLADKVARNSTCDTLLVRQPTH